MRYGFERNTQFAKLPDKFLSDLTFRNFIDRVCSEAAMKVDLGQPFANGRWAGFRAHLVIAPLSHCAYHLTLRRVAASTWTLDSLLAAGWCTPNQKATLLDLL